MIKKIILLLILIIALPISSKADEPRTIIWEEDFSGCNEMPNYGMNSKYEYNTSIRFSNTWSGHSPYVSLGNYDHFFATISLYGIFRDLQLSLDVEKDHYPQIWLIINEDYENKIEIKKGINKIPSKYEGQETIKLGFYIKNTGANLDNLKLTGIYSGKGKSPELSYSKNKCNITLGDHYNLPKLSNPYNQEIYYWSSDKSVASISNEGKVTVNGVGSAIIYAICHESEDFGYQVASYTLNVNRNKPYWEVFYESFDKNENNGGNNGDLHNVNDYNLLFDNKESHGIGCSAFRCIELSSDSYGEIGYYSITSLKNVTRKDCILSFRAAPRLYGSPTLSVTTSSSSSPHSISIGDAWQDYSIDLGEMEEGDSIRLNGKDVFIDEVSVTAKPRDVRVTIGQTGYATLYYSGQPLTVPSGADAWTMTVDGDWIRAHHHYAAGDVIPRATAVVLHGDPGEYVFRTADEDGVADDRNELRGTDETVVTVGSDGMMYYCLGEKDGKVGFFRLPGLRNEGHKAYLALPGSKAKARSAFPVVLDSTTAVQSLLHVKVCGDGQRYNLAGQRGGKGYKGVVVVNGKVYIQK